jgi:hypothetical protein
VVRRSVLQRLVGWDPRYQLAFAPALGPACRRAELPRYAAEAVERHGVLRGGWLALRRLGRRVLRGMRPGPGPLGKAMDRNLLLAFALSFLVLSLWSIWTAPQRTVPEGTSAPTGQAAPPPPEATAPEPAPAGPAYPDLPDAQPAQAAAPETPTAPAPSETEVAAEKIESTRLSSSVHLSWRGAWFVELSVPTTAALGSR